MSHASAPQRQRLVAFVASLCVAHVACGPPEPAEMPDAPVVDMASGDLGQEDMAQQREDATPDTPDASPGDNAWTITLTPVEWGLYAGEVASSFVIQGRLEQGSSLTLEVPPGVWSVEMCEQNQCFTYGGSRLQGFEPKPRESLPVSGEVMPARFFNAVDRGLEFLIDEQGRVQMARRPAEMLAPRWSAPSRQHGEAVGALFDEAIARMNQSDASMHTDIVLALMRELARLNAGPVSTSQGVLFIAPGEDGGTPPEIRGSMTSWEGAPRAALRKIVGALWGRYIDVDLTGSHLYKTVYATPGQEPAWFTDVGNQHIAWDGFDTGGVGAFNSVLGAHDMDQSRMTLWWRVESEIMPSPRDVYVYFPAGYDRESMRRYPVLYIHDGNESITRGQFHQVADAWFAEHPEQAALLVFIALPSQEERFGDYTVGTMDSRGELYAKFLAEELVPRVDERLRTRPERSARGLMGASLGGLISYWTAAHYPELFEYTAGMSSSFFWEDELMIRTIAERGCQNLWFYLDSGAPADNADVTRRMRDVLAGMDCPHEHQEEQGGRHEWSFWKARFSNVLRTFAGVHTRP